MSDRKPVAIELNAFVDTSTKAMMIALEKAGYPVSHGVTMTLQIDVHDHNEAATAMLGNPSRAFMGFINAFSHIVESDDDYRSLVELVDVKRNEYCTHSKQLIVAIADQMGDVANQIIMEGVKAPKVSH